MSIQNTCTNYKKSYEHQQNKIINRNLTRSDTVEVLTKVVFENYQNFNNVNAATAIHRYAKIKPKDYRNNDRLINIMKKAINQHLNRFNPQELANTAWAFATLGIRDDSLMTMIVRNWISSKGFDTVELNQIYQTYLCYKHLFLSDNLEKIFTSEIQEMFNGLIVDEAQSSKTHLNVSRYLERFGLTIQNEVIINRLVVDICLQDHKTVIEVDGPTHFAYRSDRELGHTIFKRRLLQSMGWNVINIPYRKWDDAVKNRKEEDYLRGLIEPFANAI